MAPSRQKKVVEAYYTDIGVQGRKTGLKVPELPRDADGFERVDDFFSSPRKAPPTPPRTNGAHHNNDVVGDEYDEDEVEGADEDEDEDDEAMDIANGTSDNASSVLRSARRSVNLPPSSRSPLKTSLGGSPRRPQGLGSSPLQNRAAMRSSLKVPPRRSGNFAAPNPSPVVRGAAQRGRGVVEKPESRARKQTYDLLDDEEEEEEEVDEVDEVQREIQDDDDDVDPGIDEEPPFEVDVNDEADEALPDEAGEQDEEEEQPSPIPEPQPVKRGTKRKSAELEADRSTSTALTKQGQPPKKRGRPPKRKDPAPVEESAENDTSLARSPSPVNNATEPPPPKKRGRGPGQRNPKARISSGKSRQADKEPSKPRPDKEPADEVSETETKKGPRKPKSRPMLHLQENEEPEAEIAPVLLRSGRTSVKPLAFWRGEQIVYEPPKRVGKDLLPGGYRGVDPGRKEVAPKPRSTGRRRGRPKKAVSQEPEESEDEDQELWETEGDTPGVLKAGVLAWDSELQRGTEDEFEEMELAVTAPALEQRLQDDKAKTFRFTKTVTLPFFHSGVVDLPPHNGLKRSKNSKKNHMIFWVFSGRVQVDISGTEFSIGAGGMWQVPRGNTYELANPFPRRARIFFAQGSYMTTDDEAALLEAAG